MPPERSLPAAAGCVGAEKPERAPVQFRRRSRASRRSLAAEWGPAKANLIRQSASASHQSGRSLARSRVQPGPYADWGPGPPRSPADSGRPPMGIGSVTTLNRREVYELHGASTGLRRGERRAPRTFSTAWAAAISGFGLDLMPCGNSNEESQRDSGLRPGLRGTSYPGKGSTIQQPQRGCGPTVGVCRNPVGVAESCGTRTWRPGVQRGELPKGIGAKPDPRLNQTSALGPWLLPLSFELRAFRPSSCFRSADLERVLKPGLEFRVDAVRAAFAQRAA